MQMIAEVYYSRTDETYYVLTKRSPLFTDYKHLSQNDIIQKLYDEGWSPCGKVVRSDEAHVDMWCRNSSDEELIARWDQTKQPYKVWNED